MNLSIPTDSDQSRQIEVYRLDDFDSMPELLEPPKSVIEGIAYRGRTTLFSAREKTGKSTYLAGAASAITRGAPFLDQATECANVAWLAIDEPLSDTVRRFKALGADPTRLFVVTQHVTAAEWAYVLRETKASLGVIDTLGELWRGKVRHDKDADEIRVFLRPYITAARDTDVAQILSYHTSKGGAEYRGSVELGALVDAPLTMRRRGAFAPGAMSGGTFASDEDDDDRQDDGRRLIIGMSRWGRVRVRIRSDDGLHYVTDDAPPASLTDRVLAAVRNDPGRSGSDLARKVTGRKSDILHQLRDLARAGKVEERAKGWWPSPVLRPVPDTVPELPREPVREPLSFELGTTGNRSERTGTEPEPVSGTSGSQLESYSTSERELVEPASLDEVEVEL